MNEKKRIFDAVRESEERYRRLVELSPDGIIITSEFKFLFMNPSGNQDSCREIVLEDFLGKSVFDFIHCDHRQILAGTISENGGKREKVFPGWK